MVYMNTIACLASEILALVAATPNADLTLKADALFATCIVGSPTIRWASSVFEDILIQNGMDSLQAKQLLNGCLTRAVAAAQSLRDAVA